MPSELANINWPQTVDYLWHIVVACALAVPIGLTGSGARGISVCEPFRWLRWFPAVS
jgi:hypothetical protein